MVKVKTGATLTNTVMFGFQKLCTMVLVGRFNIKMEETIIMFVKMAQLEPTLKNEPTK